MCAAAVAAGAVRAQDASDEPLTPPPVRDTPSGRTESLEPYEGRPIRRIVLQKPHVRSDEDADDAPPFDPLDESLTGLTLNTLRSREGAPFRAVTVTEDIARLNRVGRFRQVDSRVQLLDDGTVALVFTLTPQPVIADVQVVGNKLISDEEIDKVVDVLVRTPLDRYQLGQATRRIENMYRTKGHYLAQVTVDETELEETGIVIFRIREGDRVKVTEIRFEGNRSLSDAELKTQIRTRTAWLFDKGPLDDEVLDQDVAAIVTFYRDRGHLDIRADRLTQVSPDGREAIVTFLVDEGAVYTLRRIDVVFDDRARVFPTEEAANAAMTPGDSLFSRGPNEFVVYKDGIFTPAQMMGLMRIKPGDVYSVQQLRTSVDALLQAYGEMGYVDVRINRRERRAVDEPNVDVLLTVHEGARFRCGEILVRGNELTRQEVILHEVKVQPGRPLDSTAVDDTRKALGRLRLFDPQPGGIKVTVQEPDPVDPEFRDVLVEVKETNTGSFTMGVAVGSDSGIVGQFRINQRNFDVADTPDSLSEFIAGRAFRGAGQTFTIDLQPGTEYQNYGVTLGDPTLFDTRYSGSVTGYYSVRDYDQWDEDRLGVRFALGRQFGERWSATMPIRLESVNLRDIDDDAPQDYWDFKGDNNITSVGLNLTRTTYDDPFRPSKGTKLQFGLDQAGMLGGDFTFTTLRAEHGVFIPLHEDFMGRKTVASSNIRIGYIPQDSSEVPVYERFYMGGQSFRGFRFRTISPRGPQHNDPSIESDDPIGGTWMFYWGLEVNQPLIGEMLSVVGFLDTGTVTNSPGFEDYRASVGVGFRLYVPQLSPAPLAFDFGFPILSQDPDRERVFSFTLDLPFN